MRRHQANAGRSARENKSVSFARRIDRCESRPQYPQEHVSLLCTRDRTKRIQVSLSPRKDRCHMHEDRSERIRVSMPAGQCCADAIKPLTRTSLKGNNSQRELNAEASHAPLKVPPELFTSEARAKTMKVSLSLSVEWLKRKRFT